MKPSSPRRTLSVSLLLITVIPLLAVSTAAWAARAKGADVHSTQGLMTAAANPVASTLIPHDTLGVAHDPQTLYLKVGPINTTERPKSTPALQVLPTASGQALHLIQFTGPIQDAWLDDLKTLGAQPVHYIANYGYLVWAGEPAREELAQLAAASTDFLRFSAPYTADMKVDPLLAERNEVAAADELLDVTIQLYRHPGVAASETRIDALAARALSAWTPVLNYQNKRFLIEPAALAAIATLPDVVWISAELPMEPMDEVQAQILAGNMNQARTDPSGPGYLDWLLDQGFSTDPADYPIIDITDDGIGNGAADLAAGDVTFRVQGDAQGNSRVAYLANCTSSGDGSGPDGHGHLNASIAAGFDLRSGFPYRDEKGFQRGLGINPFGRIAGTRVFDGPYFDNTNCGSDYLVMLEQSYEKGARIVSNSWGCTSYACPSTYTLAAQAYDAGVRDAHDGRPGNQEMLILFSAGNVGSAARVGSPANAKNVIAVGATENVRPEWIDGCGFGGAQADSAQDIASYSSRGPAPGGRVKPDLVAPGTHVMGTASTTADYNGSAICDTYQPTGQSLFAASTGTSHSVPAVAGMASLASFWLAEKQGVDQPSPALLKAFLINSAEYLSGVGANDDLPSNAQGYGLPAMRRAFGDTARVIIDQEQSPLFDDSGESWSLKLRAANHTLPVRVVLAYTDQPGAAATSDPRVNNLDLRLAAEGRLYLGNVLKGPWSRAGGEADPVNTVEAIFLPPGSVGTFTITVEAANIAGDGVPGRGDETDQDFALICDNCRAQPIDYPFRTFVPMLLVRE